MKKLLIEFLALMLIICGCSPLEQQETTFTPIPQVDNVVSKTPTLDGFEHSSVIFDEMWLDMDGDGIDEYAQLSSGSSKLMDSFCLEPILTVYKDDLPLVSQPLFAQAGYVTPYFGKAIDFSSDGKQDLHIMYNPKSVLQQKEFCIYGLFGNSLTLLSPSDAYLATLYHVPNRFIQELEDIDSDIYEKRFDSLVDFISDATDQGEQRAVKDATTSYTNFRFNGPLKAGDIDENGTNELLYNVASYAENGDVRIYDVWIGRLHEDSWNIISKEITNDFHTDVLSAMKIFDGTLHSYAFPGTPLKVRDKKWFSEETELLNQAANKEYRLHIDGMGNHIYYELLLSEAVGDRILSITLQGGAIHGSGLHPADAPIAAGISPEQAKAYLGETPLFENEHTLTYLREPYEYNGAAITPDITGFEVLHFEHGKLVSIEFVVGTDYQIGATRCKGNFNAFSQEYSGGRVDAVVFYTICGYRTYLLEAYPQATCLYPPDFSVNGKWYLHAGKNILAQYMGQELYTADYRSQDLITPYGDSWTPTIIDYQEIPRFVFDYDGDGYDEILAEVFTSDYRLVVCDINLNSVYEISENILKELIDPNKARKLNDDMMKLLEGNDFRLH